MRFVLTNHSALRRRYWATMPRRSIPDPTATAVGKRIRQLRQEAGLTIEKLAYESELGSKGHLSSIERGLVRPTIETLRILADRLDVLPADLLNVPEDGARQKLIDRTRTMTKLEIRQVLRSLGKKSAGA